MRKIFLFVLIGILPTIAFSQIRLTNDICFFAYLKNNNIKLTENETAKFLKRYHNEELNKNASDEFELRNYIKNKTIEFQGMIDTLVLIKNYFIDITVRLGEYDFDKKGFTIFYDDNFYNGNINPSDGYGQYNYLAKSLNVQKFTFLGMEAENAKKLIDYLKLKGNIKRVLPAIVKLELTGKTDKYEFNLPGIENFSGYALCNISDITILIKDFTKIKITK